MARSDWAPLALALFLLRGSPAGAQGLYLYVIPTALEPAARLAANAPLRVAAYTARPEALAALSGSRVRAVAADHVELELGAYPQLAPSDPQAFLGASFVLDFGEPAVVALREQLLREHAAGASPEQLRRFVAQAITDKTSARGFDLASRVAASRSGDCTEHAVLLAALARSLGRPARVALGTVLIEEDGGFAAFGHAWAELHDAAGWRVLDAALDPDGAVLHYLPLGLLADEGPGYAIGLTRVMQQTWIARVEILGNAEP
jgi:transglutaminase-like putative cysteine protease